MTVIAIRKSKDTVAIAADQQTSYGHAHKAVNSKERMYYDGNKIFQENGMTIAMAGSVKGNAFMKVFSKNHKPKTLDEDGLIDFMVEFQEWCTKKDKEFKIDMNHLFIISDGMVFEIRDGLLVREIKEYASLGSGRYVALGVLFNGGNVTEAVEAAKEFDMFCGGKTQTMLINLK